MRKGRKNKSAKLWTAREIIKTALSRILTLFTVCVMAFTLFSVSTFNRNDRSLFGHKFFVAQTSSMAATDFEAGDIVVSKANPDPAALKEGDVITFVSQSDLHYGKTVTHKIREINIDEHGNREFVTYGTTTNTNDDATVGEDHVIGKYEFRVPGVGRFFAFLKTVPGYIMCILIPFISIIAWHAIDCWYFLKKYRQMSEDGTEIKMILSREA